MSRTGCLRGSPWAKEAAHYRHYRAPRALSALQAQSDVRQPRRSAETRGGATRLSTHAMRATAPERVGDAESGSVHGARGLLSAPRRLRPPPTRPLGGLLAQRIRPDGCQQLQKRCSIYSS